MAEINVACWRVGAVTRLIKGKGKIGRYKGVDGQKESGGEKDSYRYVSAGSGM